MILPINSSCQWIVKPSVLKGSIQIPSSKSQSIRALLFALLARGRSTIYNLLRSPDVEAMLTACAHLGARIEREGERVEVVGVAGRICGSEDVIQAGNSGLILRLVGAIAALSPLPIVITGDHSIRHIRPVSPLLDALSQLGVEATSLRGDGGAPILIRGPIHAGRAVMEGADSQPVSGVLIASAFAEGPVEIDVKNPGERPWVHLTLDWLKRLGISYVARNEEYYRLEGNAAIEGFTYRVPGDFSSVAYPLVAALLTGSELCLENLDFKDLQGDKRVITYLQEMGAPIEIDEANHRVHVKKCKGLRGTTLDLNECIDALPILAVVGCFAEGKTELRGAAIARKKESDRIQCIAQELNKMGACIEEHPDGLTISRASLKGAEVHSCFDHRIALSLAIAGLASMGTTIIKETACVDKSYPNFCAHMQSLGASVILQDM